jgi:hypothetical protein
VKKKGRIEDRHDETCVVRLLIVAGRSTHDLLRGGGKNYFHNQFVKDCFLLAAKSASSSTYPVVICYTLLCMLSISPPFLVVIRAPRVSVIISFLNLMSSSVLSLSSSADQQNLAARVEITGAKS